MIERKRKESGAARTQQFWRDVVQKGAIPGNFIPSKNNNVTKTNIFIYFVHHFEYFKLSDMLCENM